MKSLTISSDPKVSRADHEEKDADLRGEIELVRVDFPKAGHRPLIRYLKRKGIEVGETRLRRVIEKFELQIRPKKKYVVTTNSNHDFLIYPNHIKGMVIDGQLATDALRMAILRRKPPRGVIHHSDRGVQYLCNDYVEIVDDNGFHKSCSAKGNPYDNAWTESFMSQRGVE